MLMNTHKYSDSLKTNSPVKLLHCGCPSLSKKSRALAHSFSFLLLHTWPDRPTIRPLIQSTAQHYLHRLPMIAFILVHHGAAARRNLTLISRNAPSIKTLNKHCDNTQPWRTLTFIFNLTLINEIDSVSVKVKTEKRENRPDFFFFYLHAGGN